MASGVARGRVRQSHPIINKILIIIMINVGILVPILHLVDVGHLCYGQLTPVKTRYPPPVLRDDFRSHRDQLFVFEVDR